MSVLQASDEDSYDVIKTKMAAEKRERSLIFSNGGKGVFFLSIYMGVKMTISHQ